MGAAEKMIQLLMTLSFEFVDFILRETLLHKQQNVDIKTDLGPE